MSKFNPILLVMQPREICATIDSIKENVKFPRVWFKGYTEPEVLEEINKYVKNTDYSHYIICADDVILTTGAIEEVVRLSQTFFNHAKISSYIATGWCNLYQNPKDNTLSYESNIAEKEIPITFDDAGGGGPKIEDYSFSSVADIFSRRGLIRTYLASFAFSCIPREVLMTHPLSAYVFGGGSDLKFSHNITKDGTKIWTSSKMFIKHLRENKKASLRPDWVVGKIPPITIEEL